MVRAMIAIAVMLGITASLHAQPRPRAKPTAKPAQKQRAVAAPSSNHVAADHSYCDLKLVGVVSQGSSRKALVMDPGNHGHILKLGDRLGRERVRVRAITSGGVETSGGPCSGRLPPYPLLPTVPMLVPPPPPPTSPRFVELMSRARSAARS